MKKNNCDHQRVKKNYPFGRKSRARKKCKDCGEVITNKDLEKIFQERKKRYREY